MASESAADRSNGGLEGVVVATTALSDVDGEAGRLTIAGRDVETLAADGRFEPAVAALWDAARVAERPDDVAAALGAARAAAFERLPSVLALLSPTSAPVDGMSALRAAIATLPSDADAVSVTAAVAVFAAAWSRLCVGAEPTSPVVDAAHAADYLRMATGHAPSPAFARAMGAYLSTVSDHGMNASTFAARVVASTGSDLVSSVVAAIGALKGPLHGGAGVAHAVDAVAHAHDAPARVELGRHPGVGAIG